MLGDTIRNYRKNANLSQDELAEKLDVTRQSISLWENGQTQPSLENIVALAKIFNVRTDALLDNLNADVSKEFPDLTEKTVFPEDTEEVKPNNKKALIFTLCGLVLAVILAIVLALTGVFSAKDSAQNTAESAPISVPVEEETTTTTTAKPKKSKSNTNTTAPAQNNDSPRQTQAPATEATTTATTTATNTQKDLYQFLKDYAIKNGKVNGDYCVFYKTADTYGGSPERDFTLSYWGDTDTVEFCLHTVIDDETSFNFYIKVPQDNKGKFKYVTSYYFRDTGASLNQATGIINSAVFTREYPLSCDNYSGDSASQNTFMEESRQGICELIDLIRNFMGTVGNGYSFDDFTFYHFE